MKHFLHCRTIAEKAAHIGGGFYPSGGTPPFNSPLKGGFKKISPLKSGFKKISPIIGEFLKLSPLGGQAHPHSPLEGGFRGVSGRPGLHIFSVVCMLILVSCTARFGRT